MKYRHAFNITAIVLSVSFSLVGCGVETSSVESSIPVAESSVSFSLPESSSSEIESSNISSSIEETSSSIVENKEPGVGDVIKKWSSNSDYGIFPLDTPNDYEHGRGNRELFTLLGRDDRCCLSFDLFSGHDKTGYITSNLRNNPFLSKNDIKNGYIISLYVYVVEGGNVDSFQLQALSTNYADEIYGQTVEIGKDGENTWKRITVSYDSVDDFKALKLIYNVSDPTKSAGFLVDDVEITIGTPTVTMRREPKKESLYKLYEDDFKIGTCLSSYAISNNNLKNLTLDHFNSVTAENEGKPEHMLDQSKCQQLAKSNPSAVAVKTSSLDSIYNFAESNHIMVRHHTFVWHNQTPSWFFTEDYTSNGKLASKELMLRRLDNFMRESLNAINDKWPGLVYAVDVANEAIDYGTVRKNNNKWYDTLGSEYVYYAMKSAHKYKKPYQDLYYNDYSYDFVSNNCSYALNTLLKKAIDEKLVDGLGIQGHLISSANMDTIIKDAKMIYSKGLKCQITELDIGISDTTKESYEKQQSAYGTLVTKILQAHKNGEAKINAIVLWGVSDNYSWRPDEYPLLFDTKFQKKPAYDAFYNAKFKV